MILRSMGLLTMVTAFMFIFSSCSKTADGNLTKEQQDKNLEATAIDEKDITESDEDLTTVDYKEFYDQLSPHGEWVQVSPAEIGLQPQMAQYNGSDYKRFSLSNLLGINDAYAANDLNVGMVYVWKPSTDLVVTRLEGVTPVYVPYTNGQWVNTDAGWYFKAPTPVEETTSHYGRWVNSPTAGWLWVPGRVWAPAWVDWKQNDNYVSWVPLPPSVYLVNGNVSVPPIDDNNYVIVEKRYFLEPDVYRYNNVYYDNGDRILIREMVRTDGIIIVNNRIINRGPDVGIFQTLFGRTIELVKIQHVYKFNEVRYSDGNYFVYSPNFKRYKSKDKIRFTINEPKSFKKYGEWKDSKFEKKEFKKEEKEYKKLNKGNDNDMKNGNDNNKKYKDNYNGKKNDGNDNGKKNDGNYNGRKQDGNDNGKKDKGNGNGKKNDGKNNGKGKK